MGVGSSTVNFQTNITIITLAAWSVFPCGWYCDSSCDTQDNVTLTCVGCLILYIIRHPGEPNLWVGARLLVPAECCPPSAWHYFLLFTYDNKICPLCHLSVTMCTQFHFFDCTWLLTSILHTMVYSTLYFIYCGSNRGRCKRVPISYFYSLWKPRNERNYASNKKSGLKGERSAAPLKQPQ